MRRDPCPKLMRAGEPRERRQRRFEARSSRSSIFAQSLSPIRFCAGWAKWPSAALRPAAIAAAAVAKVGEAPVLAQHADFEKRRQPLDFRARQPETGHGMREQARRHALAAHRAGGACATSRASVPAAAGAQGLAGRIVDRDAEARQFRADAAGEVAIGRHQRRRCARASPEPRAGRWRAPAPPRARRPPRSRSTSVERRVDLARAPCVAIGAPILRRVGRTQGLGNERRARRGHCGQRRRVPSPRRA